MKKNVILLLGCIISNVSALQHGAYETYEPFKLASNFSNIRFRGLFNQVIRPSLPECISSFYCNNYISLLMGAGGIFASLYYKKL